MSWGCKMFRTIEDIQHEMKQHEQVTQKTIGELEKTIGNLTVIIMKSKGGSNG